MTIKVTRKAPPPQPQPDGEVTLTMSDSEAMLLFVLVGNVGSPDQTSVLCGAPHYTATRIYSALRDVLGEERREHLRKINAFEVTAKTPR